MHAVLSYGNGRLRVVDISGRTAPLKHLNYFDIDNVSKGVAAGDFLVFLSSEGLKFAKWSRSYGEYVWLGDCPGAPEAEYDVQSKPLPPYSESAGSLPQLEVSVALAEDTGKAALDWMAGITATLCPAGVKAAVREAVGAAMQSFLRDVERAGLHYCKVWVAAARRLADGRLWQLTEKRSVGASGRIEARVLSAGLSDGLLRMRLGLSRSPFAVTVFMATILALSE